MSPAARPAYLGLGSNLGDRRAHLRRGIELLPDVTRVSSVYETDPVGGPEQGPYLNCVAELFTELAAPALLEVARRAESDAHRERGVRWGPRTLDVDLLLVGDEVVDTPELVVPHPRMWERGFVLVPLAELAPHLVGQRAAPALAEGVRPAGTVFD